MVVDGLNLSISLNTFRTHRYPEFYCSFTFTLANLEELHKITSLLKLNIPSVETKKKYYKNFTDTIYYSYDCAHILANKCAHKSLIVEASVNPLNGLYTLIISRREYLTCHLDKHVLEITNAQLTSLFSRINYTLRAHNIETAFPNLSSTQKIYIDYGTKIDKRILSSPQLVEANFIIALINNILARNLLNSNDHKWHLFYLPTIPVFANIKNNSSSRSCSTDSPTSGHSDKTTGDLTSPFSQRSSTGNISLLRPLPLLITRESFVTSALETTQTTPSDLPTSKTGLLSVIPVSPAPSTPFSPVLRRVTLGAMADRQHSASHYGLRRCSVFSPH